MPSHLAYGIAGDEDKIPPNSPVYFDLHLVKVN